MSHQLVKKRTVSYHHYAEYEYRLARESTVPFLRTWQFSFEGLRIIDVGCGAGGTTEAFYEAGSQVTGIDIDQKRIDVAQQRAAEKKYDITYFCADGQTPPATMGHDYDCAIVRDVLEHVDEPHEFMRSVQNLVKPSGQIFLTFPPYFSAYGGHQHHPESITRFLPWSHVIFPGFVFRRLLPPHEDYRKELKSLNRLTINKAERIFAELKLPILRRQLYVIRPSLHFKHKLPIVKAGFFSSLPLVRELLITGAYYLLQNRAFEV